MHFIGDHVDYNKSQARNRHVRHGVGEETNEADGKCHSIANKSSRNTLAASQDALAARG